MFSCNRAPTVDPTQGVPPRPGRTFRDIASTGFSHQGQETASALRDFVAPLSPEGPIHWRNFEPLLPSRGLLSAEQVESLTTHPRRAQTLASILALHEKSEVLGAPILTGDVHHIAASGHLRSRLTSLAKYGLITVAPSSRGTCARLAPIADLIEPMKTLTHTILATELAGFYTDSREIDQRALQIPEYERYFDTTLRIAKLAMSLAEHVDEAHPKRLSISDEDFNYLAAEIGEFTREVVWKALPRSFADIELTPQLREVVHSSLALRGRMSEPFEMARESDWGAWVFRCALKNLCRDILLGVKIVTENCGPQTTASVKA